MTYLTSLKSILSNPVNQIAVFLFLLLSFYMPQMYLPMDRTAFQTWCIHIFNHGLSQAYTCPEPEMNYPPLMCYMLWAFAKLQGTQGHIERYFYFFKVYGLQFDFVGALFVIRLVKDKSREVLLFLLMVANPVFIYNSYIWGQVDSGLALIFVSLFFLLKEKLLPSCIVFLLVINLKPHVIIFVPPLMMVGFYKLYGKITWQTLIKILLICFLIESALIFPFILGGGWQGIVNVYLHAVDYFPKISIASFNVWVFFFGKNAFSMSDKLVWGILTYKQIGLLMFFAASFFALFPLFMGAAAKYFSRLKIVINDRISLLGFSLIPLVFFFFNTQMHERYSHSAVLFIAGYSFIARRYYLFLLFCFAYFCNMEPRLYALGFWNYNIFIFDPYFVAALFGLLIASLYFILYKEFYQLQKKTS